MFLRLVILSDFPAVTLSYFATFQPPRLLSWRSFLHTTVTPLVIAELHSIPVLFTLAQYLRLYCSLA